MKLGVAVLSTDEAGFVIVPSLHNVQRHSIKVYWGRRGESGLQRKDLSLAPLIVEMIAGLSSDW